MQDFYRNCLKLAIGFNVETVQYKNVKFQVWDLGGQTSIRYHQENINFHDSMGLDLIGDVTMPIQMPSFTWWTVQIDREYPHLKKN